MVGLGDKSLNAAELFVLCLESEGATRVFGVPGEENAEDSDGFSGEAGLSPA